MVQKQKAKPGDSEFLVKLQGFALPPDVEENIATAIRKAVLAELAVVDLGQREVTFGPDPGGGTGGPTQGIHAVLKSGAASP